MSRAAERAGQAALVRPSLGLRQCVGLRRGHAGPGDVVSLARSRRALHRQGFYNPRSQNPACACARGSTSRGRRFIRGGSRGARGPRPPRPAVGPARTSIGSSTARGGPARPGRRRVRRHRGRRRSRDARHRPCAQRRGISTRSRRSWAPDGVRAGPESYASWRGCDASRGSPAASPRATACAVVEDGIGLEVEPLVGRKTGMFIDQRETRAGSRPSREGARVLDVTPTRAGSGSPRRAPARPR